MKARSKHDVAVLTREVKHGPASDIHSLYGHQELAMSLTGFHLTCYRLLLPDDKMHISRNALQKSHSCRVVIESLNHGIRTIT